MPEETKPQETAEEVRKKAIQAYYDAVSKEEKAAVVKQYPFLSEVFSAANHS